MTPDFLKTIFAEYTIGEVVSFEKIAKGLSSINYKVTTEHGIYFLKQHRPSGAQRLSSIEQAEQFFNARGIPVITPVQTKQGTYHLLVSDICYVLYPFVTGIQYESGNITSEVAATLGSMLAKAHALSKNGFTGSYDEDKSFNLYSKEQILQEIEDLLQCITGNDEYDRIAYEGLLLKKKIVENEDRSNSSFDTGERHLCFGDYYPDNIFFDAEGNITHIFDLDMAGPMPRLFELVRSMFLSCFWYTFDDNKISSANAFVTAYYNTYPFEIDEFKKAFELFYVKSAQSIWMERAHYLKQDFRSDTMYKNSIDTIHYLDERREELYERLLSTIF